MKIFDSGHTSKGEGRGGLRLLWLKTFVGRWDGEITLTSAEGLLGRPCHFVFPSNFSITLL